jgi:AAA15 family ATPase/GTPase
LVYGDIALYATKKDTRNNAISLINFYLGYSKESSSRKITLNIDKTKQTLYIEGIPNDSTSYVLHLDVSMYRNFDTPFIPFYKGHDDDLTSFYSKLEDSKQLKNKFINSLKVIVPDIDDVTVSSKEYKHLIIYQKHIDSSIPLAFFGDGAIKLFRLLAEIILNAGSRIMIDEVDAGIHYSRFKEFWRVILKTAKENEVQLFMTTHNEECIKYFKEVLEEESNLRSLTRSITLVENRESKKVTAHTYSFEELEHAINVGNEIRA